MRATIKALLFSSMLVVSANADFLMTLTDKNGVEENLCVKNYSFSNTLESLHKQENQTKDVYSTQETLTNKIYLGKSVYRKVLKIDDFIAPYTKIVDTYSDIISLNIDEIINYNFIITVNNSRILSSTSSEYVMYNNGNSVVVYSEIIDNRARLTLKQNHMTVKESWNITKGKFIVEYTKTTDTAQSSSNELTTMVHYLPSDSSTGEYITKSLDETGIRFLKNYRYDENTSSCVKN